MPGKLCHGNDPSGPAVCNCKGYVAEVVTEVVEPAKPTWYRITESHDNDSYLYVEDGKVHLVCADDHYSGCISVEDSKALLADLQKATL